VGNKLTIQPTLLNGVVVIRSERLCDERGSFGRWFCQNELSTLLHGNSIRQINHSLNLQTGVVRGLHFQYPPAAEYKLVRCIHGRVQDIVVDLRAGSASFLQHLSIELRASDDQMVLIPPGCAHGFQALADNSQLLYLHTADYQPGFEAGVQMNDPLLKISLPLPISQISQRDLGFALLTSDFSGINV